MSGRQLRPHSQVVPCVAASSALLAAGLSTSLLASSSGVWWTVAGAGGSLVAGQLQHQLGSRLILIHALLLSSIGCLAFTFGWTVWGEWLAGSACGLSMPPVSILISLMATSSNLRPLLTSLELPAFCIGLYTTSLARDIFQAEGWTCAVGCLCCMLAVIYCVPDTRPSSKATDWFAVLSRSEIYRSLLLTSTLAFLTTLTVFTVLTTYSVDLTIGAVCLCACLLAVPLSTCMYRRSIASYAGYLASLAILILPYPPSPPLLPTPTSLPLLPTSPPSLSLFTSSPSPDYLFETLLPSTSLLLTSPPSTPLLPFLSTPSLPSPTFFPIAFLASSALFVSALFALLGEVFIPEFRVMGTSLTLVAGWCGCLLARCGLYLPAPVLVSSSVMATLVTIAFFVPPTDKKVEDENERETTLPLQDVTGNIEFIKVNAEMVS